MKTSFWWTKTTCFPAVLSHMNRRIFIFTIAKFYPRFTMYIRIVTNCNSTEEKMGMKIYGKSLRREMKQCFVLYWIVDSKGGENWKKLMETFFNENWEHQIGGVGLDKFELVNKVKLSCEYCLLEFHPIPHEIKYLSIKNIMSWFFESLKLFQLIWTFL